VGKLDDAPDLAPASRAAWRRWLSAHHATSTGVWLVLDKTSAPRVRLAQAEAIEEALCGGWIDSLPRTVDATRWKLWFAPRKPKSVWSAVNKARVARMIASGQMAAPGLAAIATAKANGAWASIDAAEALEIPADLAAALRALPKAQAYFAAFPPSVKRGILGWIALARTPATRAARVATTAEQAAVNRRAQFERVARKRTTRS
jgi:uncharacterized protein YdeI (YjbR/CyaY-like superfamily)